MLLTRSLVLIVLSCLALYCVLFSCLQRSFSSVCVVFILAWPRLAIFGRLYLAAVSGVFPATVGGLPKSLSLRWLAVVAALLAVFVINSRSSPLSLRVHSWETLHGRSLVFIVLA
jgi:hypothetical protein